MAANPNNFNFQSKSAICHQEAASAKTAVQGWNFEWPGDDRGDQQMDRSQLSKPCLMEAIKKFDLQECENLEDKNLVEDLSKLKQSMIGQSNSPDTISPSTPRTDARNNLLEMSGHKVPVLQPAPPSRKIPRPPSAPNSGTNTPQRWGRKIRSPILPPIIKGISLIDASKEITTETSHSTTPPKPLTPQPPTEEGSIKSDLTQQNEASMAHVSIDRNNIFPIVYSPTFLPPLKEENKHILKMMARGKKVPRLERNITLASVDPLTSYSELKTPNFALQYMTDTFKEVHPTSSAPASLTSDDKDAKQHQPDLGSLKIDTRSSMNDASPVSLPERTDSVRRCSSMSRGSKPVHLRILDKVPHTCIHQAASASELGMNLSTKKILPAIATKPIIDNDTVTSDSSSENEESLDFLTLTKRCLPKINAVAEAKVREKVQKFRDITEESLQHVMNRMDFDCFSDEWTFPEDNNLYRAVLLRNHALNHGIIYRLQKQKTELTKDVETMENFQKLARQPSQVMTLEHLENGEIKEHKQLLIFDKNKGKTFIHKAEPLKLGNSLLSVIDHYRAKAKKNQRVSTKKSDPKLKEPSKHARQHHPSKATKSQQCNVHPTNGFVHVPIRIQNLPPIKVSGIGPRQFIEKVAEPKLRGTSAAASQIPHPPTSTQYRFQPIKTINETITMKSFKQSIHGTKLSQTKNHGPVKAFGKRTE